MSVCVWHVNSFFNDDLGIFVDLLAVFGTDLFPTPLKPWDLQAKPLPTLC